MWLMVCAAWACQRLRLMDSIQSLATRTNTQAHIHCTLRSIYFIDEETRKCCSRWMFNIDGRLFGYNVKNDLHNDGHGSSWDTHHQKLVVLVQIHSENKHYIICFCFKNWDTKKNMSEMRKSLSYYLWFIIFNLCIRGFKIPIIITRV